MNRIGHRTVYAITAPGIKKGRIGATLGRLNLNGMKAAPARATLQFSTGLSIRKNTAFRHQESIGVF